jgi:ABC-2 type transport system ATP-binding protein
MTIAVQAIGLRKRFSATGSAVAALDDLCIEIPEGGVFGLLGENGAGKSTFFRIILGLMRPDAGIIRVLDSEPSAAEALYCQVGAMIEAPRFFNFMSARQNLQMLARLKRAGRAASIETLLERVGLIHAADRKVHGFSVGMKQRLGIAAALVARPRLVILDEPTSGMDPIGIQEIRQLIRELSAKAGVTVLLASHQLDEVRKLCDRIAIIHRGAVRAEGSVAQLLGGHTRLCLTVDPIEHALAFLRESAERHGDTVLVTITEQEVPSLIASMVGVGIRIFEARWVELSLEDLFVSHVGRGSGV